MKIKMALKLTVLGFLIVGLGLLLRGHDILTGLALSVLLLAVICKIAFALIMRRRGGSPPGRGGGDSARRPTPRPPGRRPPALSAAEEVKHGPAF